MHTDVSTVSTGIHSRYPFLAHRKLCLAVLWRFVGAIRAQLPRCWYVRGYHEGFAFSDCKVGEFPLDVSAMKNDSNMGIFHDFWMGILSKIGVSQGCFGPREPGKMGFEGQKCEDKQYVRWCQAEMWQLNLRKKDDDIMTPDSNFLGVGSYSFLCLCI